MPSNSAPPPGLLWIEDAKDEDGNVVLLGIASRLGITVSTYRKWRMDNKGPGTFRLGGRVVARATAVEDYIAEQERSAEIDRAEWAASDENRPPEPRRSRQHATASAASR